MTNNSAFRKYVTAPLLHGYEPRQGVLIYEASDHIILCGETGTHVCEKNYTEVPASQLWGRSKEFAKVMGVTNI